MARAGRRVVPAAPAEPGACLLPSSPCRHAPLALPNELPVRDRQVRHSVPRRRVSLGPKIAAARELLISVQALAEEFKGPDFTLGVPHRLAWTPPPSCQGAQAPQEGSSQEPRPPSPLIQGLESKCVCLRLDPCCGWASFVLPSISLAPCPGSSAGAALGTPWPAACSRRSWQSRRPRRRSWRRRGRPCRRCGGGGCCGPAPAAVLPCCCRRRLPNPVPARAGKAGCQPGASAGGGAALQPGICGRRTGGQQRRRRRRQPGVASRRLPLRRAGLLCWTGDRSAGAAGAGCWHAGLHANDSSGQCGGAARWGGLHSRPAGGRQG